jgi:hypothetical protein
MLSLTVREDGPTENELTLQLRAGGYEIRPWGVTSIDQGRQRELRVEVRWRARPHEASSPTFLQNLVNHPGVLRLEWQPG